MRGKPLCRIPPIGIHLKNSLGLDPWASAVLLIGPHRNQSDTEPDRTPNGGGSTNSLGGHHDSEKVQAAHQGSVHPAR